MPKYRPSTEELVIDWFECAHIEAARVMFNHIKVIMKRRDPQTKKVQPQPTTKAPEPVEQLGD